MCIGESCLSYLCRSQFVGYNNHLSPTQRVAVFAFGCLLVGEDATAKMVWGIVAAAVAGGVALLVLLWLVSVPLYGCAPVPFKTCFARLVRTTAKPKEWSFTRIEVSCTA